VDLGTVEGFIFCHCGQELLGTIDRHAMHVEI